MKTEIDGMPAWLEAWKNDPATGRGKMYAHAMGRLLKKLPVPLEQLTPELLEGCAKKVSDSFDFREKLSIGVRHFVDYCHAKGWIMAKPQLRRNRWHSAAAEMGDGESQYYLGVMYFHGDGVKPNKAMAVSWLKKSANSGNERAAQKLTEYGLDR